MIAQLGLRISAAFRAVVPDPFVIAVLLLALSVVLAVTIGQPAPMANPLEQPGPPGTLWDRLARLADSFREVPNQPHAWSLLAFSMQMCLVLVSGYVLAATPLVRRAITLLAARPSTGAGAAAMVAFFACATGIVNWGLGLIVGALLARETGRSLAARGVPHHAPLLAAAGYFGLMVWHGGLSGSAPLTMTTPEGAARTLPPGTVQALRDAGFGDGIALTQTLFTPLNAVVTLGLLIIVPALVWMLAPSPARPQELSPTPPARETQAPPAAEAPPATLAERLDRSWLINALLAAALAVGLAKFLGTDKWLQPGLNEITAAMLVLGLLLHPSPRSLLAAVDDAAGACGGIILQFPIYAAIIAVMINGGLITVLAEWSASVPKPLLPCATFLAACVVNLFVPSGGGQWAVQGPIALDAALRAGVDPGKVILAVAYGDQTTNMLQPFWALPLLAITGAKARDIVGYTALVMLAAILWICAALLVL
jgi:short-chain fatty acids transporter